MKTPSDDLFTLVKSLNPREKVFFKVYSANKSSNRDSVSYLKLFDVIDKLEVYNKSLLRANLAKIGFKHHIKKAKRYLAEAILNSLEEYHSDISVNAELQKLLHRVEFLISKKLHKLAKKLLHKAEQLALEHEVYDYLTVIYSLKKSTFPLTRDIKDIEHYLNHDVPKEKQYLERLNNTIEFGILSSQMRATEAIFSKVRDGKYIDTINSIINSPLLSSSDRALSFSSLKDYYSIHLSYSHLLGKWDNETLQRQKKWLTYLESHQKRLGYRTQTYFVALINLMLIQIKMGSHDEVHILYEKIKKFYCTLSLKKRTESLSSFFAIGVFNYMEIQRGRGNPEKALKTWEQVSEFISFNAINSNARIQGYGNLSDIYFMLGNYREALKYANKILDFREKNLLNIQAISRIYVLLIHYELNNYGILPYLAKSAKRFLIKHGYFSQIDKLIIGFFEKKMPKTNDPLQYIKVFSALKEQIEDLCKNSTQVHVAEYFDFVSWVESKISNKPLLEIIREKVK